MLKDLISKAKSFIKEADSAISDELKGNATVDSIKEKAGEFKEKIDGLVKKFSTEEIEALDKNDHLLITLVLGGLDK